MIAEITLEELAGAARAVARACATNPVALVIPCHRVVRRDGEAGGYRHGAARKQALLDRERQGGSSETVPAVACRRASLATHWSPGITV